MRTVIGHISTKTDSLAAGICEDACISTSSRRGAHGTGLPERRLGHIFIR